MKNIKSYLGILFILGMLSLSTVLACSETDSGLDFFNKGVTTSDENVLFTDYCTGLTGNTLKEFFCSSDGYQGVGADLELPPSGQKCQDGEFVPLGSDTDVWCLTLNLVCVKRLNDCVTTSGEVDYNTEQECHNAGDILRECNFDSNCDDGFVCENSKCIPDISPKCVESDEGIDFFNRGTVIGLDGTQYVDACTGLSGNTLKEFYCWDNGINGAGADLEQPPINYKCQNGEFILLNPNENSVWCLTERDVCVKRVDSCIGTEETFTTEESCYDVLRKEDNPLLCSKLNGEGCSLSRDIPFIDDSEANSLCKSGWCIDTNTASECGNPKNRDQAHPICLEEGNSLFWIIVGGLGVIILILLIILLTRKKSSGGL